MEHSHSYCSSQVVRSHWHSSCSAVMQGSISIVTSCSVLRSQENDRNISGIRAIIDLLFIFLCWCLNRIDCAVFSFGLCYFLKDQKVAQKVSAGRGGFVRRNEPPARLLTADVLSAKHFSRV